MKQKKLTRQAISLLVATDAREAYTARYHGITTHTEDPRRMALRIIGGRCACCGTEDGLTIDHVVPVCKLGEKREPNIYLAIWCGRVPLSNLQILCAACNRGKGVGEECAHRVIARHIVLMMSERAA
jgi:5-methylcytosine-specific restriction endonuclease McrA